MKKRLLTLLFTLATVCGFAQDGDLVNPGFYEIKGKVKNAPDGTVLCLMRFNTDYGVVVGNDTISTGSSTATATCSMQTLVTLMLLKTL